MTASLPPAPAPADIRISDHAVEQYLSRVKPGLPAAHARRELEMLRDHHGLVRPTAPPWARDARARSHYLVIGEDLVLPLAHDHHGRWAATTCLTPGTLTDVQRRRRAGRARRRKG